MMFTLPKLNYAYDALEPFVDALTMEIHHSKHHQTYITNFNAVLEKYPALQALTGEEILKNLNTLEVSEEDRKKIKNHGGGFVNHSLFWEIMGPNKELNEQLIADINSEFGSVEKFKADFTQSAIGQFGSGWAWLVYDENNKLKIYSLPNQDSPLTIGHKPMFCLDVWEHAYYLKYQNRRADYVNNWWNVLKLI
ncbi:MAG: superoxide dismutase [Candidatus Magasanikbacteria bacterium RIFOXYD2_FULL_36_9]|uniref:Superoxide dismutase n=1 Tax=Candidatus Magasanikbacteria bacterium RIFOXYD2_FULL_36_9 TaxID=1798707 RepID=A0A1F6NY41_9BACT|nr:MAG: superoxide dismutase [Candidatus Magasanikbacteria bacterium RIFOXYD2_FULL_36_9]